MLENLTVKNFQAHQNLVLDFDDKITTIIGRTDSGKSAAFRALRWVCQNVPLGSEFIRHGQEECSVSLDFDGHVVSRCRGKKNTYEFDGEVLKSFVRDVPSDIADALKLDDSNFQGQFDPSYWLTLSGSDLSKQLNQVVDLGSVDEALTGIQSTVRSLKKVVQVVSDRFDKTDAELSELSWVEEADEELSKLETLDETARTEKRSVAHLERHISTIMDLEKSQGGLADVLWEGEKLIDIGERYGKNLRSGQRLKRAIDQLQHHQEQSSIEVPDIGDLQRLMAEYNEASSVVSSLDGLIIACDRAGQNIESLRADYRRAEEEFQAAMGDVCPLCERSL